MKIHYKWMACLLIAGLSSIGFQANAADTQTFVAGNTLTKSDGSLQDAITKAQLQIAYNLNPVLSRFSIKTEVDNGIVTLDGALPSNVHKTLAETIATDLPGVKDLNDRIVVDPQTKAGEETSAYGQKVLDATITAMVKTKLLGHTGVSGSDITVTTVNNVVSLTGVVKTLAEKRLTGELALKTPGVSAVKNNLIVSNRG